ncbi:MAG TPA: 2-dehydro-3-deoxy-D-gluconate 5-dehydrogenase KduD [Thermoanaerobaculia bacterium]|nr:2-dehydro-3-deoxy-D-gluconate 5-dehydrogenase KduD [Thermoanaerobaculia bacterium]
MSVLDGFRLDGQVAIVTGASRGLGAAMALALAEAGADVALVARGDTSGVEASVRTLGRRAMAVHADLEDRAAPDAIMKAVGKADILINNAGIIRRAAVLEYSDDDWDAVIEVNLRSVFALSRAFARAVVERKATGRIVNIASMLSFQGGIRVVAYTAAKSGILGLTRALANELAPMGINVNAIAPGYMATDNTQALRDDPVRSREILARIPAGRWGVPDDLKGAVVFLASPAAAYVHGAVLAVDGGWLAR